MSVAPDRFVFGIPDRLRPLPEGWRYESARDGVTVHVT